MTGSADGLEDAIDDYVWSRHLPVSSPSSILSFGHHCCHSARGRPACAHLHLHVLAFVLSKCSCQTYVRRPPLSLFCSPAACSRDSIAGADPGRAASALTEPSDRADHQRRMDAARSLALMKIVVHPKPVAGNECCTTVLLYASGVRRRARRRELAAASCGNSLTTRNVAYDRACRPLAAPCSRRSVPLACSARPPRFSGRRD